MGSRSSSKLLTALTDDTAHAQRTRRPRASACRQYGQEHVLAGWDRLDATTSSRALLDQLRGLDLEQLRTPVRQPRPLVRGAAAGAHPAGPGDLPARRTPRPGALRRGGAAARRGGGAGGGRRPGQPARLRASQGDVPVGPVSNKTPVPDPRREGAGPAAARYGRPRAVPGDDQPGDRRRDARRSSQEHKQLRPAGGRGGLLLPGDDAGARPGDGPAADGGPGPAVPQPQRPRRHADRAGRQRPARAVAASAASATSSISRWTIRW